MSLMDDVRELAQHEGPVEEGFIIAFQPEDFKARPDACYRTLFVKKRGGLGLQQEEITGGGSLRDALLFPTYHAAAVAASSWSHTRAPGVRIIHIKRTNPFELLEDLPANILDAVVEA